MSVRLPAISVSLVDDNDDMRESLARYLRTLPDITCVSTHGSGADAVARLPPHTPRVALMDINMRGVSGIEAVGQLKPLLPQCDFVMLTAHENPNLIFRSLRAGATGYLLKTAPLTEIAAGVRAIAQGGVAVSAVVAMRLIRHFNEQPKSTPDLEKLSPREYEILELLANGWEVQPIADHLGLSLGTLRNYQRNIYRKLQVSNRTGAVRCFIER